VSADARQRERRTKPTGELLNSALPERRGLNASSVTFRVRRFQPTLVVIDRTEHEAADLVVPAQDPIGYGEHLAASVATRGSEQHRGPVEDERRVTGEGEGWCVPRSQDKRNEYGDVDGVARGPVCS
jgi:hypothetical protein